MTNAINETVIYEKAEIINSNQIVQLTLKYIDVHLSEKINLSDMAHQLNVCRSTLVQSFRQVMGISPYAYVLQRKLETAQKLIGQGVSPVQTAREIGFDNYSSFYRAFRKRYHMSPSEWKEWASQTQIVDMNDFAEGV